VVDRTALGTYLNDHLAGSVAGLEAMDRLSDTNQHTSLGRAFDVLRHRAKNDQDVLRELLVLIQVPERTSAKTFAWIGEKVSRLKLGGDSDVDTDLALFEALETLTLGFYGRLALWHVLATISGELGSRFDFPGLARQVQSDLDVLEQFRLEAGAQALSQLNMQLTENG
jgi:hypothetical protein